MSDRETSEQDWLLIEAYFKQWSARVGTVVVDRLDQRSFGNRIIEAMVGGLRIRLVRDRDTVLLDVTNGEIWHSGKTVMAFVDRLTPSEAIRSNETDGAILTLDISKIGRVLSDPKLARFEDEMADLAVRRLSTEVGQIRSTAAASA